jgi:hypothetical protein
MARSPEQTPLLSDVFGLQNVKEILQLVYPDLLQPATRQLGSNLKTIFEYLSILCLHEIRSRRDKAQVQRRLRFSSPKWTRFLWKSTVIPSSIAAPALDQLSIELRNISSLFISSAILQHRYYWFSSSKL